MGVKIPKSISNLMGSDLRFSGWHKSPYSNPDGNCVEVDVGRGEFSGYIGVRDSKNPHGAALAFTPQEWDAFIVGVKSGMFDEA